ncbi:MAG: NACHT domain-containing protein [Halothece sp. Uz-M2-17]|nr:NACHT domain-containing protein [Halothece sp. Uz-M2-17]
MKENQTTQGVTSLHNCVRQSWLNGVLYKQLTPNLELNLYLQREQCYLKTCDFFHLTEHFITLVGKAGMGKTLLLTQLVEQTTSLLPLLLDLTPWSLQANEALTDWIITQTKRFYAIPPRQVDQILARESLLLLLDNFDAISKAEQTAGAKALTQLHHQYPHWTIVVATRPPLCTALPTTDMIVIQPLADSQVTNYLANFSSSNHLSQIVETNPQLQTLSRIPFYLSRLSLTDPDVTAQLQTFQMREHLLSAYIERQLRLTSLQPYSSQQLCTGLGWLARKLDEHQQTVLFIDDMRQGSDQDWLDGRFHDQFYLLCVWLIGGVMTTPIIGLSSGVLGGLLVGWFRTPLGSLLLRQLHRPFGGAIALWFRRPVEQMAISQIRPPLIWLSRRFAVPLLRQPLWKSLLHYGPRMIIGTVFKKSPYWLRTFATMGVVRTITARSRTIHPNQGIWQATRTMVGWGLGGAMIATIVFTPLGVSVWYAKLAGLLFGLFAGGITCIEHFLLRVFLTLSKQTPWNYSKFLDKAVSCGFLYRVGRGYSFVHRDLQAYFQRQCSH